MTKVFDSLVKKFEKERETPEQRRELELDFVQSLSGYYKKHGWEAVGEGQKKAVTIEVSLPGNLRDNKARLSYSTRGIEGGEPGDFRAVLEVRVSHSFLNPWADGKMIGFTMPYKPQAEELGQDEHQDLASLKSDYLEKMAQAFKD